VSTLFVVVTGVVTPIFAIESIQDERRNTNFDLLHLSRLSTVQILVGKLTGVLLASFALIWRLEQSSVLVQTMLIVLQLVCQLVFELLTIGRDEVSRSSCCAVHLG
jgi:hypothetical protein